MTLVDSSVLYFVGGLFRDRVVLDRTWVLFPAISVPGSSTTLVKAVFVDICCR